MANYDELYGIVAVDVRRSGVYRRRWALDGIFENYVADVYAYFDGFVRNGLHCAVERLYDAVYVFAEFPDLGDGDIPFGFDGLRQGE